MRFKLRHLDLNLLVVFAALIEDRSVTRVAAKLASTQSTVSQALARLRAALDDDLFVRTPEGMMPTPYAERLAGPVAEALTAIEVAVEGSRSFDPSQSARRFVLSINNQAAVDLAPRLARAAARAPGVTLDMRPSGAVDVAERLDLGASDLAIGGLVATAERFRDRHLYDDEFVVVSRQGGAAMRNDAMSLQALADRPHLLLSSTGDDYGFVDEALARAGRRRRIALHAPLLAARGILATSDMLAVVSRRTAAVIAGDAALTIDALPFPSPALQTRMLWHRRWDDDPGHAWLRALVTAAAQGRDHEGSDAAPDRRTPQAADSLDGPVRAPEQ